MGLCVSVASSDQIHNAESEHGHDNAVLLLNPQNDSTTGLHVCSVYSKAGSKGLNQDSAVLYQGYGMKGGTFCGVFDGHGKNGHVVSEMVRNRLPLLLQSQKENVTNFYKEYTDSKPVPDLEDCEKWKEAVVGAFQVMDKEIKLQEHLDFSCSGTTAVVAIIRQGEDLIMANLGDSRAVLGTMTENGIMAVQLTTDLKPSLPSEAERIRTCKGRVTALKNEQHIQRVWLPDKDTPGLAMSRAFGDFLLKDYGIIAIPDVSSHRLTSNDQFLVLATDGVWDVMSNDQVVAVVWEVATREAAARAVVETANAAWKKKYPAAKIDDCTVVCLFFQNKQKQRNVVAVKS